MVMYPSFLFVGYTSIMAKTKKILFIEDEPALQSAVEKFLTEEGFQILSALDGESGIQIAKREIPDLILLDIILPHKNGFQVLDELNKDPSTKNIPIILAAIPRPASSNGKETAVEPRAAAKIIAAIIEPT